MVRDVRKDGEYMDLYNLVLSAKITKGEGGGGGDEPTGTKEINITQNGVTTENVKSYASAKITTSVPVGVFPSGTKQISSNGSYDVSNFASAAVNISPIIQSLSISENGTYSVPSGVDGYNPITVNVSGGGGGGGDHDAEDAIVARTISGAYVNNRVTTIGTHAFASCSNLTEVSCENVTMISSSAFYRAGLRKVSFPNVVTIQSSAFCSCALIGIDTSGVVSFPNLETIQAYAFGSVNQMRYVTLPKIKSIYGNAFREAGALSSLYILASSVPYLQSTTAFTNTPLSGGIGKIYVPASLVDSYKSASVWSAYSAQITAYTE